MRSGRRSGVESGFDGGEAEAAVDREIRHHIEELADRLETMGFARGVALVEARRRFGDMEQVRGEMVRETKGVKRRMRVRERVWGIVFDVRYAVRALGRNPTFAVTVVGTVALGIGAVAAVFTILDGLLLRPLPYDAPEELFTVNQTQGDDGWVPFLWADQVDTWMDAARLETSAQYETLSMVRTDSPEPAMLSVVVASATLDDVLGVRPYVGRSFRDEDAMPGANRAMLTWRYWMSQGGERGILETTMELDGEPYEVVGVLPRDFKYPVASRADAWVALARDRRVSGVGLDRLSIVTRLPAGVNEETMQARFDALADALAVEAPHRRGWQVKLDAVQGWRGNPDLVRGVWMMACAVALMLLVALVNGVNLLLFRAADRSHELAVRMALGGGRVRLLHHLLAEGLVIGLAASFGAVVLAVTVVAGINRMLPSEFAFSSVYTFRVESRVLLFTFMLSLLSGVVLGFIPALRALRGGLQFDVLKGRGAVGGRNRLNQALVGIEVALVVTLLGGAGLLTRSVMHLLRKDAGFDVDQIVTMAISLPESRYASPAQRAAFFERLERELESIPEVHAATVADGLPPHAGFSFGLELQAEGAEVLGTDESQNGRPANGSRPPFILVPQIAVRPDFVAVLGARMVEGRAFEEGDVGLDNVMVDDQLARALWDGSAVGRRFRTGASNPWFTVVGVFQHMPFLGLDDRASPWAIAYPRNPNSAASYMSIGIRTAVAPRASLVAIRDVVRRLDPDLPIAELAPARTALIETIDKPRFLSTIMLAVAGIALVLTAIGIYGVLSYAVTQRRREMGIRMALGSMPQRVRSMIVRSGLVVAAIGSMAGLLTAIVLSRLVASLLFGVQPNDPLTLGAAIAIVLLVAAAASWIPATRATRVNPVEALRAD
jgi:predicted permease